MTDGVLEISHDLVGFFFFFFFFLRAASSPSIIAAKALRKEDGISYVLYRLCKEKEGINRKGQKCVARNIGVW